MDPYDWFDQAARDRGTECAPLRVINRDLGYPIIACDDDGVPLAPELAGFERERFVQGQNERWAACLEKVRVGYLANVFNSGEDAIEGTGVFAGDGIKADELVGCYAGTMYTEEAWDLLEEPDENFLFNLRDGEQGILLDGSTGTHINALKFLNHSCTPNVKMEEAFLFGQWYVLVYALRDIQVNEELVHDFDLHTEDELEKDIECKCASTKCRGRLFRYYSWSD
mmetsp:Transcript_15028/g.24432  ORF Transcript_15028/g.24432 Transcript_15028/m.24432 type:complete len:225 (+) Transcript_15028:304-978(+)|eukprot:CAMPEP_0203748210 /NCGR_PEP_ID=MMETSP0098-20131031/3150_1 /ASSEMBLY_ACC=CAM_ASM_000208 /TAXON_ID=96639 /ORGANISM=" , Strain NY0313808BC1" /LENGTH=224 /DNA_ID=CAMNT_0050636871 /DNA_START=975 /DNA_END=1649 /DNA_ORIENTATION=-